MRMFDLHFTALPWNSKPPLVNTNVCCITGYYYSAVLVHEKWILINSFGTAMYDCSVETEVLTVGEWWAEIYACKTRMQWLQTMGKSGSSNLGMPAIHTDFVKNERSAMGSTM